MTPKKTLALLTGIGAAVLLTLSVDSEQAWAHKEKHTAKQLEAFNAVFMEQGATTMAWARNDHEAIEAPMSLGLCTTSARSSISPTVMSSS